MLKCAVKFCGGCNPLYQRRAVYERICQQLDKVASFSLPKDGEKYDVLLIVRGCTGCPYLYEEIAAENRLVAVSEKDADRIIAEIQSIYKNKGDDLI